MSKTLHSDYADADRAAREREKDEANLQLGRRLAETRSALQEEERLVEAPQRLLQLSATQPLATSGRDPLERNAVHTRLNRGEASGRRGSAHSRPHARAHARWQTRTHAPQVLRKELDWALKSLETSENGKAALEAQLAALQVRPLAHMSPSCAVARTGALPAGP